MRKWLMLSALAMMVTFCLFVFMAILVKKPSDNRLDMPLDLEVDIFSAGRQIETSMKTRSLPKPPPVVQPKHTNKRSDSPPVPKPSFQRNAIDTLVNSLDTDADIRTNKLANPFGQGNLNGDAAPIIRIAPHYPTDAALKGIEGWVKLSFSIDKTGLVTQLRVIESSPPEIFDDPAKRALAQWLYKAKFVNGSPVVQNNLQVQLDFNLAED